MYLEMILLCHHVAFGLCYVGYDMFTGFGVPVTEEIEPIEIYTTTIYTTTIYTTTQSTTDKTNPPITEPVQAIRPITAKFKCPEEESPSNIGAYEIPSQRDLILFIKKSLMHAFNSYHMKALYFLKDISEATKATYAIEDKCHGQGTDKKAYRACVRDISHKCELITKTLVISLESKRNSVSNFTEGMICNIKLLKADPVQLIKRIVMEEASLEFALPGFLRLLGSCSVYCKIKEQKQSSSHKKPSRSSHMTDQQLVVKHLLTKKSYLELLQDG